MTRRLGTKNLILVGFMGTGKSTIGWQLAKSLGRKFIDTDELIEDWVGKPITQIFTEDGEPAFREWEYKVAQYLSTRIRLVVATGGGFVTNPDCVNLIRPNSRIYTLVASPEVIYMRTVSTDRPLLQVENPTEKIAELLAARAEVYGQFRQMNTDNKSPLEVVDEILEQLR